MVISLIASIILIFKWSWNHHFELLRSLRWLGLPVWNICVVNDHGYVPLDVYTSRSFHQSQVIIGFVIRLTRLVPLVEQELSVLSEHMSSSPVCSGVCVTRSLVLCVCFVDRCLSFCPFSFDHCVVCSSSILITPLVSSNSSYSLLMLKVSRGFNSTECDKI